MSNFKTAQIAYNIVMSWGWVGNTWPMAGDELVRYWRPGGWVGYSCWRAGDELVYPGVNWGWVGMGDELVGGMSWLPFSDPTITPPPWCLNSAKKYSRWYLVRHNTSMRTLTIFARGGAGEFTKDSQIIKAVDISRPALAVSSQLDPWIYFNICPWIWAVLLNDIFLK